MMIAIGSNNPVKITAVCTIVKQVWPAAQVQGVKVPSGVSSMPMDDKECIAGARGRAAAALQAMEAELALGLEGGVHPINGQLFLTGWVAAIDQDGQESVACAARLPLPLTVSQAVLSGQELGPLMDQLTGRQQTNHAEGAIGILTQGLMTRQQAFEMGVAFALAPWISPEWYALNGR